jgi:putative ABC transport system permease protein
VGGLEETPTIPDLDRIEAHVAQVPFVEERTLQISGFGQLGLDGREGRAFGLLFGIEPESYREMFDNTEIQSGRYLEAGERGILLSADRVEEIEEEIREEAAELGESLPEDFGIEVGDEIIISTFGNAGFRIRVLPLVGIYEFTTISQGVGAELISYVDAQTMRALLGLNLGFQGDIELLEAETALLDTEFGTEDLFSDEAFAIDETQAGSFDEAELDAVLGDGDPADSDAEEPSNADGSVQAAEQAAAGSSWHYMLLRLERPRADMRVIEDLNAWFDNQGIDAQAANWEAAAGPFATTADVIRTVFNIAIIVVGVVAVIIIMNTLVISVMERTSEIGTMRALGAQRGFVWRMFMTETLALTTTFGLIGVAAGLGVIGLLNAIGIPATNTFLRVLFAGDVLRPEASAVTVVSSVLVVSGIGLLAHLYPVTIALRIPPIRAIQTE